MPRRTDAGCPSLPLMIGGNPCPGGQGVRLEVPGNAVQLDADAGDPSRAFPPRPESPTLRGSAVLRYLRV